MIFDDFKIILKQICVTVNVLFVPHITDKARGNAIIVAVSLVRKYTILCMCIFPECGGVERAGL